jgi:hypothetical protein
MVRSVQRVRRSRKSTVNSNEKTLASPMGIVLNSSKGRESSPTNLGSPGPDHRDKQKKSADMTQITSIKVKSAKECLSTRVRSAPSTISMSEVAITVDILRAAMSSQDSNGTSNS